MTTVKASEGTHTRSMLRAVAAGLVAWGQVGPFNTYGFVRADGQHYTAAHAATLVALHDARVALLIEVCFATGRVTLTDAGRQFLAVPR